MKLLVVFSISMNLFAGMLVGTGVSDTLHLNTNVGQDQAVQNAEKNASNIQTGAPTGSTLFGMYNTLTRTFRAIGTVVFAAPDMLFNAGVPKFITTPLRTIMAIGYGIAIIELMRGFSG